MILKVENLSAGYSGSTPVLREATLEVAAGEIAAVIGPNGCGKSTLLRCISGLMQPQTGAVFLNGKNSESYSLRERAQTLALLAQSFAGSVEIEVEEMALLGRTPFLNNYGTPTARDRDIARRALQQTDTEKFRGRTLGELSGGEKQRVLLARALAQEPKILLLDEPTSNLDIRYQFEILDLVFRLARKGKIAVVLVLHQINLAAAVADSILLLNGDGTVCASGTPGEVVTRENLQNVYHVPLEVFPHPQSGRPQARAEWVFGM
jgi:iron complex transport system ATP-binding protein